MICSLLKCYSQNLETCFAICICKEEQVIISLAIIRNYIASRKFLSVSKNMILYYKIVRDIINQYTFRGTQATRHLSYVMHRASATNIIKFLYVNGTVIILCSL